MTWGHLPLVLFPTTSITQTSRSPPMQVALAADTIRFQVLSSLSSQGSSKSIAVPSKLYHPRPSLRKPLSGIRVSISDFTSLNGTGSALSSRAWASLYSTPSMTTAGHARSLIDLGAIIVGKTKTSHLSTGVEWVDEQAPWSARGDGYQTLFGPSVGAAAGLLGYEWLQQSIGCDGELIRKLILLD